MQIIILELLDSLLFSVTATNQHVSNICLFALSLSCGLLILSAILKTDPIFFFKLQQYIQTFVFAINCI